MSTIPENIRVAEYGDSPNNLTIRRFGDQVKVELAYPQIANGGVTKILVNQESVRASDDIRLSYDYERDGWIVEQASRFAWAIDDAICDPDWQEVAFIKSWSREETEEQQAQRIGN